MNSAACFVVKCSITTRRLGKRAITGVSTRSMNTASRSKMSTSVGSASNKRSITSPNWVWRYCCLSAIVVAIVVGKPLVITILARFFGQPWRYAVATGLCLAQIGEFSFVLATIAQAQVDGVTLLSATMFQALVSATIFSLLLTPYLVAVAPHVGATLATCISRFNGRRDPHGRATLSNNGESVPALADAILIIGFGPAGQRVAEGLMDPHQGRIVVVDLSPDNIAIANRYGLTGILGDATQAEVLEHAGIHRAACGDRAPRSQHSETPDLRSSRSR